MKTINSPNIHLEVLYLQQQGCLLRHRTVYYHFFLFSFHTHHFPYVMLNSWDKCAFLQHCTTRQHPFREGHPKALSPGWLLPTCPITHFSLPQDAPSPHAALPAPVQPNPALFTHSSTWTAHGDIYHKMEFGVHHLAVKSVRYWIYMVFAEHIRRSSSSCLFKTAVIIQAVILSHWCFWKNYLILANPH